MVQWGSRYRDGAGGTLDGDGGGSGGGEPGMG